MTGAPEPGKVYRNMFILFVTVFVSILILNGFLHTHNTNISLRLCVCVKSC